FEKGAKGRDKVCGDGLTPRAVAALSDLDVDLSGVHRIDGLRMLAGSRRRHLPWPQHGRFASQGAVWPRRLLDAHLIDTAERAGADVRYETSAEPVLDGGRVVGVETDAGRVDATLTVIAAGAQGRAARLVGA